jgi:hypothetical protein
MEDKLPITKDKLQIVTLTDFKAFKDLPFEADFERYFECTKCGSSVICIAEEYLKNNTLNSMEGSLNDSEKIVLRCDNCNHMDLLLKFLKKRKRVNYSAINYGTNWTQDLTTPNKTWTQS